MREKILGGLIMIGSMIISSTAMATNLMNEIFRPSTEAGATIDIGSSKKTVGASIFEGGTTIDIQIGNKNKPHTCYISNVVVQANQTQCEKQGHKRKQYSYKGKNNEHCVKKTTNKTAHSTSQESCERGGNFSGGRCRVAGREVHINELREGVCKEEKGTWSVIDGKGKIIESKKRQPLVARIATLLLKVTITLSVTFVIYSAVQYALAMNDSGKAEAARKKLINIMIGVVIALSSLSIIYLIQSIINQSIR